MTKLSASFYSRNRQNLQNAVGAKGPIVIPAAGLLQKSADTTYQFRQDSNFWYLTGVDDADIVLVIDAEETYLILPPRNEIQVLFDGVVERTELTKNSGIVSIYDATEGWKKLKSAAKRAGSVASVGAPPVYVQVYGFYTNPARTRLISRLKRAVRGLVVHDIRPELARLRAIKQKPEIELLNQVVDVTLDTLDELAVRLPSMRYEYEAAAFVTHEFHRQGYEHGYEPIVASGGNACTVHYIANNSPIDASSYLLLDVGAQASYYTADITRVLHPGRPSRRQYDVLAAVKDVQSYAMSLLRPGVTLGGYEEQVEEYMGKKLIELGLIEAVDRKSVRQYFPYLTSHFLGVDVHDVGDRQAPLEAGMTLTVEPGIHIPEEGIAVRLEDDVVITKNGIDVLGSKR